MQGMLLKVVVTLGMQLLTSAFLGRTIVIMLRSLAKNTDNELDDAMVNELAKALGCDDLVVGSGK
jgi:hypothetical protein